MLYYPTLTRRPRYLESFCKIQWIVIPRRPPSGSKHYCGKKEKAKMQCNANPTEYTQKISVAPQPLSRK